MSRRQGLNKFWLKYMQNMCKRLQELNMQTAKHQNPTKPLLFWHSLVSQGAAEDQDFWSHLHGVYRAGWTTTRIDAWNSRYFEHLWDCSDGLLWRHTTILSSQFDNVFGLFSVFVTQDHNFISYDKSSYSFDMSCSDTQVPCARGNAVSVSSSISFCTIFHVITSLLGAWMECGAVAFWEKTWHKAAMHPNRCFCIGNNSVKACRSMLSQDETKPNNQHGVSHKTYTASVHLRISKISKISSDLVITLTCPFHPLSLVRLESEACHRGWERKSRNRITAPRGPNFSRTPSAKVFRCTWVNVKTCCFCSASYEERCAHETYPCTRSRDKFIR